VTSAPASAAETGCAVMTGGLHAAGGGCGCGVGGGPAPEPLPYTAAMASRSHDCRLEPYGSPLKATLEFMMAALALVPPAGGWSEWRSPRVWPSSCVRTWSKPLPVRPAPLMPFCTTRSASRIV